MMKEPKKDNKNGLIFINETEWPSNHITADIWVVYCEKCNICFGVNSCDFSGRKCPKHGDPKRDKVKPCSRTDCPDGKYDCDECKAYYSAYLKQQKQ